MKEKTLIAKINLAMPEAKATPAEDFYGKNYAGIWFRGSEDYHEGVPIFYSWNYDDKVHPKLEKILNDAGWDWEPYDAGTLMAFPA